MINNTFSRSRAFLTHLIISILFFALLPNLVWGQEGTGLQPDYEGELIKNTIILEKGDLINIVFRTIQYILAFLGVVAMVILIYGGFIWMTAAGSEEKVGKAKKIILQGLIGLLIVLLAYAIAAFVIKQLHTFAQPLTPD